jgi:pimeloyl-ACP methyl ester carboxylesterase
MNESHAKTASLVLIPGLNNTRAVFDRVLSELPPQLAGFAVDNPALPSVDEIAQALLPGLPERFWLAGFSFGGYVAMALLAAAPHRVQGIAMICTSPAGESPAAAAKRQAALDAVAQGRYFEMIDAQAANAFHPDSLGNDGLMQARKAMVRDYGPQRFSAHIHATISRPDRSALLDGSRPTLVVSASHDQAFTPAVMAYADSIPGVRKVLIQGAGHLVPMEKPIELAHTLAEWVRAD